MLAGGGVRRRLLASASARFLSQEWWAPSPPLPSGDGGQQRGSGWRPDKEGGLGGTQRCRKLGTKLRGLGAAGRRTTRTPKQKVPFVSRAAQSFRDPGGPASPASRPGSDGPLWDDARSAHPAEGETGRTWAAPEGKPGQPASSIKGPASSE